MAAPALKPEALAGFDSLAPLTISGPSRADAVKGVEMKIQEKWDNYGERCVACGHARKFHWETMPYGDVVMKRSDNPEMKCMWNFEIGRCEQHNLCGCVKRKQDFCVISGI